jgi:endonuclease/exonuclease/phosphatase (EEP) superfamily protein YafD
MNTLNALVDEVLGMFVDDGSLAIAILVVVALAGWVSLRFENASAVVGALLLVGCLAVLIENVVRTARRAGR